MWVDPVSAHACEEAVKIAKSVDSIALVTLHEFTTDANFTAGSYERLLLRLVAPGVDVEPLGTEVGVAALRCASVYMVLLFSILWHLSPW